jgi:hypothetical protein
MPPQAEFRARRLGGETADQIAPPRRARREAEEGESKPPKVSTTAGANFDHKANAPPVALVELFAAARTPHREAHASAEDWAEIDRALGDMGGAE